MSQFDVDLRRQMDKTLKRQISQTIEKDMVVPLFQRQDVVGRHGDAQVHLVNFDGPFARKPESVRFGFGMHTSREIKVINCNADRFVYRPV